MIPGFIPLTFGAGLAEGAASSDFPLSADNSDPHGLAYVHRGGGRLYVGDGDEHVYCYNTGGRLLNRYVVANPLPVAGAKTTRGAIVSLTQVGDYLAVVYGRLEGGEDECSIVWRTIRADGFLDNTSLSSALAPLAGVTVMSDTSAAPITVDWAAGRTYFIVERGERVHGYIYTNDPPAQIAGAADASWPYFGSGSTGRILGYAPWHGTFECNYQCGDQENELHAHIEVQNTVNGFLLGGIVRPSVEQQIIRHRPARLLSDAFVASSRAALTRGLSSHPDTSRIFVVSSDGRLRTYTAG